MLEWHWGQDRIILRLYTSDMYYLRQGLEVEKCQSEVGRKECGKRRERRDKREQLHFKAGWYICLVRPCCPITMA